MAAHLSPSVHEQPVLLFCDTFSHQENEEMHLDLVSFPRPVAIFEVRVIPAGHRVHVAISEREKVGETSPPSFKLDMFIRNLDHPSAVTFERLGILEYKEPNNFHIVPNSKAATDVVVLRGWYTRITICLYGFFTDVARVPEPRPEPRADRPPVIMEPRAPERVPPERSPMERGQERIPERVAIEPGPKPRDRYQELSPEIAKEQRPRPYRERSPVVSPPRKRSPPPRPVDVPMVTVAEPTAAKPTTPPGTPPRDESDAAESGGQSGDELFEPLTPDHSPSNLFLSDEGEDQDDDQDHYEEILSEEEDMDDGTYSDAALLGLDTELYSEDAWMSVSVSFNPYQCDLSPLMAFPSPDCTMYETAVAKLEQAKGSAEKVPEQAEVQKLQEAISLCNTAERNMKWVETLEQISGLLVPHLAHLVNIEDKKEVMQSLVDFALYSVTLDSARKLPIAVNIRLMKAGLRLVSCLCTCGQDIATFVLSAGIQELLFELLNTEHMSSSMKLLTLQALDSTTDCQVGMEYFMGWAQDLKDHDSKVVGTDAQQGKVSCYQKLIEFLLTSQTVRVAEAASALATKLHLYEVLANLQNGVEKIVQTTQIEQDVDPETSESASKEGAENQSTLSAGQDVGTETGVVVQPISVGSLSSDELEAVAGCLEEISNILENAPHLIVQPPVKAFPTAAKITGFSTTTKDPYPVLFHLFSARRLLESILMLMSSPAGCHPAVFAAIRDLVFFLLQSQKGLLFLSAHPDTVNGLIRVLTQTTESDVHHSEAPPLQEFLRDSTTFESCTPQHLGLLLIYHLQALQAIDQLLTSQKQGITVVDMDSADILSTLHSLYSMTFTAIGKAAVISLLSMANNLASLLPFVESTGNNEEDSKLKKSVSCRYATVLIYLTIKVSENVEMLSRLAPQLLTATKREDDPTLVELGHWLAPLQDIKFEMSYIPKLVEFVKSHLSEMNTNASAACGVLVALRVLRHLACPPRTADRSKGFQKDLKWSLACIQLFSANAMDVFIITLTKLNEFLTRPWRLGQSLSTGQPLVMISMATSLLALINTLLLELLSSGTYQFKDTRLMASMMTLHTITCSAPMTGQLSNLAHKLQSEVVEVFMTFTRPVVPSSDHEQAINDCVWSLMLKELLQYITSSPQAFLGGLILLSELLPIPLPIHTIEEVPADEANQVLNHRLVWSAHLNPLSSSLQGILKSLAGSACHNLQQVMRRVCAQLSDLSAATAFNIVRTLLEVLDAEMAKPTDEKRVCSPDAVRIMTLLAYLSSQPAVKISLLQLLKTSEKARNDDLLFPNVLPSMLTLLKAEKDSQLLSRAQYCVVSIVQSLCDPTVSLTSFETPYTNEHLASTLPDKEMLPVICAALLEHVGSSKQSFATILLALRTMFTLTEHNYGVFHLKRALEANSDVFYHLLKRLSSSFSSGIPGPDHLSALSTTTELLQWLLPEDPQAVPRLEDEGAAEAESEQLKPTMEISISTSQMKDFLKVDTEKDSPLKSLEKRLEESCKEDETLESLLDGITALKRRLEKDEDPQKDSEEVKEPELPAPQPLQQLFNKRVPFVVSGGGVMEDGRVSPTLWYSTPPPDDIDPDTELVKSDLEVLREKYCAEFDLKAELEKGLAPSPPGSPTSRKKTRLGKRKYAPLISGQRDGKRMRGMNVPMRGGRGGRGMGRGRGGNRINDLFRSRKQNTSRPPSMHVDDFMAMEQGGGNQGNGPQGRRGPGNKSTPPQRGPPGDRMAGGGGFSGGPDRWGGPPGGQQRRGPGMQNLGAIRGPDWGSPRQPQMGGFPDQRGFPRGPEWGTQAPQQQYRGGGLRDNYNRPQMRGYWDGPKPKDDARFMPPPSMGGYRPGAGRGYQGRHMRSFTR